MINRPAGYEIGINIPSVGAFGGGAGWIRAATADMGRSLNAMNETMPDFSAIGATRIGGQAQETAAQIYADGAIEQQKIAAESAERISKDTNRTNLKIGKNQASAERDKANQGLFGNVASGALGLATAFATKAPIIAMSDETTKFDVKYIDTAVEKLRNLRPVTFHYTGEFSDEPERMHHGFIAQEFQEVLPDATYFDESIGKLKIDLTDVIGLLVRANQELEERLGVLEAKQALASV